MERRALGVGRLVECLLFLDFNCLFNSKRRFLDSDILEHVDNLMRGLENNEPHLLDLDKGVVVYKDQWEVSPLTFYLYHFKTIFLL